MPVYICSRTELGLNISTLLGSKVTVEVAETTSFVFIQSVINETDLTHYLKDMASSLPTMTIVSINHFKSSLQGLERSRWHTVA